MSEIDTKVLQPWYRHWHNILDEVLGEKPGFDLKAAMADKSTNFRMHFSTWELPDADLQRCFSIFSCGEKLAKRAIEMRTLSRDQSFTFTESEALEHMKLGVEGYRFFSEDASLLKDIQVARGTEEEIEDQAYSTDDFHELLEYMDCTDPRSREIRYFLIETLYRMASSYEIANFILWPLYVDKDEIDPQRHFALLDATGKYLGRLGSDGPVLFIKTDCP